MDGPTFIPNYDQAFAGDFCGKIISCCCDLVLVPNQQPLLGKDLLLLLRKNLRGDKIALCQALGAGGQCLSRLAKYWCNVGLRRWPLRMLPPGCVSVNAVVEPPRRSERLLTGLQRRSACRAVAMRGGG